MQSGKKKKEFAHDDDDIEWPDSPEAIKESDSNDDNKILGRGIWW